MSRLDTCQPLEGEVRNMRLGLSYARGFLSPLFTELCTIDIQSRLDLLTFDNPFPRPGTCFLPLVRERTL